jgi:hypothetical protein
VQGVSSCQADLSQLPPAYLTPPNASGCAGEARDIDAENLLTRKLDVVYLSRWIGPLEKGRCMESLSVPSRHGTGCGVSHQGTALLNLPGRN